MNPGGSGSRSDNITTDQGSPREGVDTLADDSAMTPRDAPDDDEGDEDEGREGGPAPYRDEEE